MSKDKALPTVKIKSSNFCPYFFRFCIHFGEMRNGMREKKMLLNKEENSHEKLYLKEVHNLLGK